MSASADSQRNSQVCFAAALRYWAWLGCSSFGGPAAQIAAMHSELVEQRRWLAPERFDHALNFCMLLPGPEAQQLATYSGWLLHGTRGGLAAGVLFVLPGAVAMFVLAWAYMVWGTLHAAAGALWGAKAAVLALLLAALLRLGKRVGKNVATVLLASGAFVCLWWRVPFPCVVLGAALVGLALPMLSPAVAATPGPVTVGPPAHWRRSLAIAAIGLAAWGGPWLLLRMLGAPTQLAAAQYEFYSGAALVTFGGAYAVLAYVSQAAVDTLGWITAAQALDGLALAETTPGPLVLVLQFVGFATGWNHPGTLAPLAAASLGAVVTTWATFLPSLLFIFLGAPWVERLRHNRLATRMLAGVTAAVLGVIAHLGVVFGKAVLWSGGSSGTFDVAALLLAAVAFAALRSNRVPIVAVVMAAAGIGWLRSCC